MKNTFLKQKRDLNELEKELENKHYPPIIYERAMEQLKELYKK